jgi:N-acyl homoserine lactone hydrolase
VPTPSDELLNNPGQAGVNWLVAKKVKLDRMKKIKTTNQILAELPKGLSGVFLTHLHPDHISGMAAISDATPLYVGKGEANSKDFSHMFLRSTVDGILNGKAPLQEWQFEPDPQKKFAGVLDIFGDQSVFAISVPGHTFGSTAYLVRTKSVPVLFTGDGFHKLLLQSLNR